jgi:hypothetical protein
MSNAQFPADTEDLAQEATLEELAAGNGTDGTGITPPTGGGGIRGWLSGIYKAITGAYPPDISASKTLTIAKETLSIVPEQGHNSVSLITKGTFNCTVSVMAKLRGQFYALDVSSIASGSASSTPISASTTVAVWAAPLPPGTEEIRIEMSAITSGALEATLVCGYQVWPLAYTIGNVLGSSSSAIGLVGQAGVWYNESNAALAANASFVGTSRSTSATAATSFASTSIRFGHVIAVACSEQEGELILEGRSASTNPYFVEAIEKLVKVGTTWRAEIHLPVSTLEYRVTLKNGATKTEKVVLNLATTSIS